MLSAIHCNPLTFPLSLSAGSLSSLILRKRELRGKRREEINDKTYINLQVFVAYRDHQMATFGGTQQKCMACAKTVYLVDKLTADNRTYHKACFRCHHCRGTLKVCITTPPSPFSFSCTNKVAPENERCQKRKCTHLN
ncbi:hypothetical protein LWI29_011878 [Acer saccharum]|uniref:LIM zinc-binding domain-containing protein n=1 Tax=Acer saccharum TaxID=4024 RepID=A0AA39S3J7_ACESA|nr:hypothetical protein LWI29_011878 [Acer saccharum]